MNKTLKKAVGAVLAGTLLLAAIPLLMFSTAPGQQFYLWLNDEQGARFYFREQGASSGTVYMKGVIYADTLVDLTTLLAKHPNIHTLVMEEVPGSIDDEINLQASLELARRGIATHVPADGMVASGGTDMFLAGRTRTIARGAKLGVHSWADLTKTAREYDNADPAHELYLTYYRSIDIPEAFYWFTLEAAPAEAIHWMTPDEILEYRVVTETFDKQAMLNTLQTLASDEMQGRGTGSNDKAQQLIATRFDQLGLKYFGDGYRQPFAFVDKDDKQRRGTNLVAYVEGLTTPESYIVIGAHYDHMGKIDGEIFNGADDNASGTAAVLSLAEHFSRFPPQHSLVFVAYDAEELGLHGSQYFVDNAPIALDSIRVKFNFDMIGRNVNNEIYIVGTHQYPDLKPLLELAAENSPLRVSYGHDVVDDKTKEYWMTSSDNAPYFSKNIPNITFSEEDHPDYHQATDDFQGIDQQFYQNVVSLILRSIRRIDKDLATPRHH